MSPASQADFTAVFDRATTSSFGRFGGSAIKAKFPYLVILRSNLAPDPGKELMNTSSANSGPALGGDFQFMIRKTPTFTGNETAAIKCWNPNLLNGHFRLRKGGH